MDFPQREVGKSSIVGWQDVGPIDNEAARFRREMEKLFAAPDRRKRLRVPL